MNPQHVELNPSAVARVLWVMTFVLVAASIAGQLSKYLLGHDYLGGLVPLFYVDHEENIPNFFSMGLLLMASCLLALIAMFHRRQRTPWVSKWVILSLGFLFMAYDEAFQVHESLSAPMRALLGNHDLGFFHFAWVIPGIALVIVLGLSFINFLLHLSRKSALAFIVSGIVYLGGAIGFELIDGRYAEMHGIENLTYSMLSTIEETLEMVGAVMFIRALLDYIAETYADVRFSIGSRDTVLRPRAGA